MQSTMSFLSYRCPSGNDNSAAHVCSLAAHVCSLAAHVVCRHPDKVAVHKVA